MKNKLLNRETLSRGLKPAIFVLLICIFVWFWGNTRKVTVEMTLRPQVESLENPVQLDVTVYEEGTENVVATFSTQMSSNHLPVHTLSMKPGNYMMRGILTMNSGTTHIVKQNIIVPNDSSSIEIYLRE